MRCPQRVLILHDYGGSRGGAEIVALDLRKGLRARGIAARLMTSTADEWSLDDSPDVACHGAHDHIRGLREAWNFSAARILRREIMKFRPDIVHIIMFLTQLSPAILPILSAVPTVYSVNTYRPICPNGTRWRDGHGICKLEPGDNCRKAGCFNSIGVLPRRLQLYLLTRGRKAIDRCVAPSNIMKALLNDFDWPCTDVVPHAVPNYTRQKPQSCSPVIAYAGRLVPEKGVDWLLRAVAAARPALENTMVIIVGDGPSRSELELLASNLGLGSQVVFTGHLSREASQEQLESAWVQVVPSLWAEPFGLVAAEAMMRGTAVITSDAGAPREIVKNGSTGLVVPTGDIAALSAALVRLTGSRTLSQQMGEVGLTIARKKYNESSWINAYLRIYGELLSEIP